MQSHAYRWFFAFFYVFAWMIAMNLLISLVFDLIALQFAVNKVDSDKGEVDDNEHSFVRNSVFEDPEAEEKAETEEKVEQQKKNEPQK